MNSRGLTIIESMIAMIILGIISVSISQFYQYTIRKNERVEQESVASAMAEDYLELLKAQILFPDKELTLEQFRIVNGDTLYYHIQEDIVNRDDPKQGIIFIICKDDTLLRLKTLLLKEGTYEP